MAYSIDDAGAPSRHTVQYYYVFGSRAMYDNGWKAELAFPSGWITGTWQRKPAFDENAWELYNLNDDPTERADLAKKYPEKLAQLKAEFEEQAKAHHLYPFITWDDVVQGRIHRTTEKSNYPQLHSLENVTFSEEKQ